MADTYAAVIKLEVEGALKDARKFLSHLDPAEDKFKALAALIEDVAASWSKVKGSSSAGALTKAAQEARELRQLSREAVEGDAEAAKRAAKEKAAADREYTRTWKALLKEREKAERAAYANSYAKRAEQETRRLVREARKLITFLDPAEDSFRELSTLADKTADDLRRFGPAMKAADATRAVQGARALREQALAAAQAAESAGGSVRGATLSSQNLVRVIQDLPYGIMGVANNVEMVAQDFATMKAEGLSAGQAVRRMVSGLAGPMMIPLLISLVTMVALSWDKVAGMVEGAGDRILVWLGRMTEAQESYNEALRETREEASGLFDGMNAEEAAESADKLSARIAELRGRLAALRREDLGDGEGGWRSRLFGDLDDAALREEYARVERQIDTLTGLLSEATARAGELAGEREKAEAAASAAIADPEAAEAARERSRRLQETLVRITKEGVDQRIALLEIEARHSSQAALREGDRELAALIGREAEAEAARLRAEDAERQQREAEAASRKAEAARKRRADEAKRVAERDARAFAEIEDLRTKATYEGAGERIRLVQLEMDRRIEALREGTRRERELAAELEAEAGRQIRAVLGQAIGEAQREAERNSLDLMREGAARRIALAEWEGEERAERYRQEAADAEAAAEGLEGDRAAMLREFAAVRRRLAEQEARKTARSVAEVRREEWEREHRAELARINRGMDERRRIIQIESEIEIAEIASAYDEGREREEAVARAHYAARLAELRDTITENRALLRRDVGNRERYLAEIAYIERQITLLERTESRRRIDNRKREAAQAQAVMRDALTSAMSLSSSAAQTLYDVWEAKRSRELDAMGKSEAEKAAIIEREGGRRFRTMKRLMVAEALANSFLTASNVLTSVWGAKGLGLAAKIGLSATLVPATFASAYAQAQEIGRIEPGSSAGGGSAGSFDYAAGSYDRLSSAVRGDRVAAVERERERDATAYGVERRDPGFDRVVERLDSLEKAYREGRDVAVPAATSEAITSAGQARRFKLLS